MCVEYDKNALNFKVHYVEILLQNMVIFIQYKDDVYCTYIRQTDVMTWLKNVYIF